MAKFYNLRNDYMFKAVMQQSKNALRNLVAALLNIEESSITKCDILNSFELGKTVDSKDCILDIKLELNGKEIIDLEIQVKDEGNWPERSLLYWSRSYDTLEVGEDYDKLKKTYHIGILDFTLFKDNPEFYSEYKIMDTKTNWEYTDKLSIIILDLTKAQIEAEECSDEHKKKLIKWSRMIKADSMEEIERIAGEEEVFKQMVVTMKKLSEDERIRLQLQAREDYERRLIGQYNRGVREGREQGIEQGITETISKLSEQMGIPTDDLWKILDNADR